MHMEYVIVGERGEIGAVGYKLPYEFVCVLDEAFLPGGIGVGEEDFGMEFFCDVFMFGELGSVVSCDGVDVPFKGLEELYDEICHGLCVLAPGGFCHEEFVDSTTKCNNVMKR